MPTITTQKASARDTGSESITARWQGNRVKRPYDYSLNVEDAHAAVAHALADNLGYDGVELTGWWARGYYFETVSTT